MKNKILALAVITGLLSSADCLGMSQKAQEAVELLKSTTTAVRMRAASNLARMRSREAVPYLIDALKDRSSGVRSAAAEALGNLGDRRSVEPLMDLLEDEDRNVRAAAVVALGFLRDPAASDRIEDRLKKDKDIGVRISAAQVLGVLGGKDSVKPLLEALSADDSRLRAQALRSLGRLKAERAAGPVSDIALSEKESARLRVYAVQTLGDISTAESKRTLNELLDEENKEIAVTAASSLGKLGDDSGLEIALSGIDSGNVEVRREAVMALSHIGVVNGDVKEAVKKAASDSDSRVRRRAEFVAESFRIELEDEQE